MIAERIVVGFAIAACVACAPIVRIIERARTPPPDVELVDLGPSSIAFELAFDRDLHAAHTGAACASEPRYAVLERTSPLGEDVLGFCDGLVVTRPHSGGLVFSDTAGRLHDGWEPLAFSMGDVFVRTEVPIAAEVRVETIEGGVRLVGKFFDLHVRASDGETQEQAAERCEPIASGPSFVLCRRGAQHRVRSRVTIAPRRVVIVESDSRLVASRRQAEEMLRSAQLLHRAR